MKNESAFKELAQKAVIEERFTSHMARIQNITQRDIEQKKLDLRKRTLLEQLRDTMYQLGMKL